MLLLVPSGCETSTNKPIRDDSHINILCERELMDFMFTCKQSTFQMWRSVGYKDQVVCDTLNWRFSLFSL